MGWYDNASNEEQEAFRRDMEESERWEPHLESYRKDIRKLEAENKKLREEIQRLKRRLGE